MQVFIIGKMRWCLIKKSDGFLNVHFEVNVSPKPLCVKCREYLGLKLVAHC